MNLNQAVVDKMMDDYGWEIKKEWIVYCTGIVSGVYSAVKALTMPGDQIVLQPPVYYPFYNAIRDSGCHVVANNLKFNGERYEMDLEDLEIKIQTQDFFPAFSSPYSWFDSLSSAQSCRSCIHERRT
jgi:cysteine-S-conjugate beta-lyase